MEPQREAVMKKIRRKIKGIIKSSPSSPQQQQQQQQKEKENEGMSLSENPEVSPMPPLPPAAQGVAAGSGDAEGGGSAGGGGGGSAGSGGGGADGDAENVGSDGDPMKTDSAVASQEEKEGTESMDVSPPLPSSANKKRVPIVNNPDEFASFGQGGDAEIPSPAVPKSDEARAALSNALRGHFLFAQLTPTDLSACVDVMGLLEMSAGQDIVVQGERGSRFFVMESGSAEAYVNGERVCGYGPGGSFGELALMYNCERAATVRATSDSRLWTMDLSTFRRSLATTASSQILSRCEFLRKVPFLAELNNEQVNKLADALEVKEFLQDEYIIRQGQQGEDFFLIEEGVVSCTQAKSATDPTEMSLLTLGPGEYFGEMALMLDEPRAANCIAVQGNVKCLSLDRTRFSNLLGPIYSILQQNMRLRILKGVPLLSKLTEQKLCRMAGAL
ncbi:conserved unknown protein [Ectocarpus siliculosus]|uniref:Cyclic nucleotide-binding domain-containing protein n=1 Tax=Ectocarpus siliculosus TaxID=2880 RepID=D8LTW1_ECTSI|nr:conserved unknown protein [Ectocarpus siliculosus]|eukprot:CBN75351.1 conserved unknown protein [Ectocarpus siliculosus]